MARRLTPRHQIFSLDSDLIPISLPIEKDPTANGK